MSDPTTNTGAGGHPLPALVGQVIDGATDAPVQDAIVSFEGDSPTHTDMGQMTNAQGGFRYPVMAAGTYTIAVRAPDGRTANAQVSVSDDAQAQVVITLPAQATEAPDTSSGGPDGVGP